MVKTVPASKMPLLQSDIPAPSAGGGEVSRMGKHRNVRKAMGQYPVGYRRPPAAKRFTKGQSGNPSGRRKNVKSFADLLAEGLDRRVTVQENGKPRRMRMRDVIVQGLINAAARREPNALRLLFRLMEQHTGGHSQDREITTLLAEDENIIKGFLASNREFEGPAEGASAHHREDPPPPEQPREDE
jgi:hypothetical protein